MQVDPIRYLGGFNLYRYCNNNPLNWIDSFGLCSPTPTPTPSPTPITVPEAPPGVNIDQNIIEAINMNAFEFYSAVDIGGKWDYKQILDRYEDFGNFNYGATGRAAGFTRDILLMMAGYAQIKAGTTRPEWGTPESGPPYGDDPKDQQQINRGINYYEQKCN